jgi:beta-lactamase class A
MAAVRAPDLSGLAAAAGLPNAQTHVWSLEPAGPAWDADDGRELYPASLIKLPLAVAAGAAIEEGRLSWDEAVTIDARNATLNDASSPMVAGYRATVAELIAFMLQRSDNVATNQLYDVLDRERATLDVRRLGFAGTAFRRKLSGSLPLIDDPQATGRNAFPAREAAELLVALARDRLPQSARLRKILATSWWDVKLSRGFEPGDTFAHKTGDTDEVSHDAGIATLNDGSRWVIVVCTDLPSSDEVDLRFGAFMRALRPHLAGAASPSKDGGGATREPANAPLTPQLRSNE